MTLKAIADRDGEVETSPLYRGWERQHPVIAQLIRDRRDLLSIVTDLQTELRELDRAVSEYANTIGRGVSGDLGARLSDTRTLLRRLSAS